MISKFLRAIGILVIFGSVFLIWVVWGMAGPRISQWFLDSGVRYLPAMPMPMEPTSVAESSDAMAKAGQWGDSFGALNALFAGLAFTGALAALLLQGRSIRRQNEDTHRERFESTYFELLALLRSARAEVRFRHSAEFLEANSIATTSKRAKIQLDASAFRAAMLEMRYILRMPTEYVLTRSQIASLYRSRIHLRFESTFGPYFRIVYTILMRIRSDNVISKDEKILYGNLLRSQLTSHELSLAGFNALMADANDLSKLLTEFRMFKYLPKNIVLRQLEAFYDPEAFASRND